METQVIWGFLFLLSEVVSKFMKGLMRSQLLFIIRSLGQEQRGCLVLGQHLSGPLTMEIYLSICGIRFSVRSLVYYRELLYPSRFDNTISLWVL